VLTDMFAKAATGTLSPKDALAEANTRTKEIFGKWRKKGMVPGGSKDR
jgi:multiple sugar transport system substrate-binding protein